MRRAGFLISCTFAMFGCAATPMAKVAGPAPEEAPSSEKEATSTTTTLAAAVADEPKNDDGPAPLPTECDGETKIGKDGKACLPPADYAKKLCGGVYPEVALGLFAKGTPFTRAWLAGDVDAWNASGGLTHRARLAFDEEVLVLAKHAPGGSGGIVMTGMQASFDVLRWDGTCVSVMEGELSLKRPPKPLPAPVPFSHLEETTRRALLASPRVKSTYADLSKACSGEKPAACEKAEKSFAQAIVEHVRSGAALPTPARRP
ncbi:MAG TPA: hypothetical protein VIF62_28360 [Labilithrix sp.]